MLNKANITWNTKQITKMVEKGLLRFDNIIQRSYVWEKTRKSELIHSILEGYPIPPFYARKVDGKIYDFLDGKQRIDAIRGYINNEYYLIGIENIEDEEGNLIDVSGKTFSELPEELQDRILSYSLTIYYYENITPEQTRTMFKKLNNGKPLSTKERNIANCVDIVKVSDIGEHEIFKHILTEKALDSRNQIPIIMKIWAMLNLDMDKISFMSKDFNEVIQETVITDEEKNEICRVLDKMLAVYNILSEDKKDKKVLKKMSTEVHLVSLVPFFNKSIEDNMLADFIRDTLSGDVSDEYKTASHEGASKNSSIKVRHEELMKAWDAFFEEDEEEAPETPQEYKYGMRLRGFSPMCQPMNGLLRREDDTSGDYHDVLVYSRELTQEEMDNYELDSIA